MRFRASYHARPGIEGKLKTVGVMLVGPKILQFWGIPTAAALEDEINVELASAARMMPLPEAFASIVERANGITTEWSEPFNVEAPTARQAAHKLLASRRFG